MLFPIRQSRLRSPVGLLLIAAMPLAQAADTEAKSTAAGTPQIHWHSVDAGASSLSSGSYRLIGSFGQSESSVASDTSSLLWSGGFWPVFTGITTVPEVPGDPIFRDSFDGA